LHGFLPSKDFLKSENFAWETERNAFQATVDWRFTTEDARIKLRKLYPVISCNGKVKEALPIIA
jgi:hypothetical protein